MARVVAYVPDLMFGSRVLAEVAAAGHEGVLAGEVEALRRALPDAAGLVVDLTLDPAERIDLIAGVRSPGLPVLGFYSHVEADVRARALEAGFDLVVPRSRMAREGAALVGRLLESPAGPR